MKLPNYIIDIQALLSGMPDGSWFTHAQIFDNLLCVANKTTASFVMKTSEGLIVIDAIYPKEEMFNAIVGAIEDIGWDPNDIKKLVITHGHFDHCGCGRWIVEKYHAETYLSKIDDEFWETTPFFPDRPDTWKDFKIDHYVDDGDEITLGDNCLLASHVFISDLDHGDYSDVADCTRPDSDPSCRPLHTAPVHIGSNVWIGEGVCILKGVTIGDGCVIGARSIVTKDLPEGSIAVGAPARVVKSFDPESGTWNRSN